MAVRMPEADSVVLAKRERIVAGLRAIVPGEGVISTEREMKPFESDGLTAYRQTPLVVVPYLRQCTPPEFSATLPPMVQAICEDGSGA